MSAVNTLIYPVADLAAAKQVFTTLLGTEPHTDESYYVGYNVDGQEIALDPSGHRKGLTGATPYWSVDDLEATVAVAHRGRGDRQPATDGRRWRTHRGRARRRRRQHDRRDAGMTAPDDVCRPPAEVPASPPPPRPTAARVRDTRDLLGREIDCWVATTDPATGAPHLVPLSFDWDGSTLLLATGERSVAGRGLASGAGVRIGLGGTRDVVMVDGSVEVVPTADARPGRGRPFRPADGFRPPGDLRFLPLLPGRPEPHPGLARGERAAWSRRDARRPVARLDRLSRHAGSDCAAVDPMPTAG